MDRSRDPGLILVTGASGQIGAEVSRRLRAAGKRPALAVDLDSQSGESIVRCDLRRNNEVAHLFSRHRISGVIHLAGILPGAFRCDPLAGAQVNLQASTELLCQASQATVKPFVFASSMSVYVLRQAIAH